MTEKDKKNLVKVKRPEDNNKDESGGFGDIAKMTEMMQNMMKKMSDIENMDEAEAETALKNMLGEVENVTKTVQKQVANIATNIQNDPNIPDEEKNKYVGLTKNLGKLSSALKMVDSDPEQAEETLNNLMESLQTNIASLTGGAAAAISPEFEDRVSKLEKQLSKIDSKMAKMEEIMKEIVKRLPK